MARRPRRSAYGAPQPIQLQADIRDKGYTWEAADTPLSAMSAPEQAAHLGLQVDPAELRATERAIAAAEQVRAFHAVAAPAAVDWRSNGGNFVTPIRDQQSCGSCVSFATLASIESRMNIACRTPGGSRDYSEAFLFYCGCGNCCGTGWNFVPALDFCKNTGVAADASFPYTPGNQPCKAGVSPLFKISGHSSVLAVGDRKNAIAERGPVIAGMEVFQDFYSYRSGVYRHVSGGSVGYHAIACIGYDDAQSCWICKNSWGTGWGDSGFFRIGYGECSIDTQFAFYEPQVVCGDGGPTPDDCARYVVYLRRVIDAARGNAALRACLCYYVCGRGRRPFSYISHLRVARIVILILRRCPRYRDPFCRAIC